jgi:putative transposase
MQTSREEEWTQSIAVGSMPFVERVRDLLGFRAKGRKVTSGTQGCQLRDPSACYGDLFEIKNDDMEAKNSLPWNICAE